MADSLIIQANAALSEKRFEDAVQLFTEALGNNEMDPTVFLGRAKAQNKLENHIEAAEDAQRATELDPKLAAAYSEQGKALHALDEFESAKEAFEMAAVLEPTRKSHTSWVNMCLAGMGLEVPRPPMVSAPPAAPTSSTAPRAVLGPQATAASPQQPTTVRIDDPEYSRYWKAPVAAAAAAAAGGPDGPKYRHQWFQTGDKIEVNVLAKGVSQERINVEIESRRLHVRISDAEGAVEYDWNIELLHEVDPTVSKYEVLRTKIEIVLKKATSGQLWSTLDASGNVLAEGAAAPSPIAVPAPPPPPYAGKRVDWDALERQAKEEEAGEKLEGDAAAMQFFKNLFKDADEDTKRAMMKSYQESGGTSLSTNWADVGSKSFKPEDQDKSK